MKLETARSNRTRYLVVVSRIKKKTSTYSNQQLTNTAHINLRQNTKNTVNTLGNLINSSVGTTTAIDTKNASCTSSSSTTTNNNNKSNISIYSINNMKSNIKDKNNIMGIIRPTEKFNQCDTINNNDEMCNDKQLNIDQNNDTDNTIRNSCEIEESCLLGIDCNEKTTVGLVLRILADTSIHLDGDG